MICKGILLDLDNTLYDYEPVHIRALRCALDWLARNLDLPLPTVQSSFKTARTQIHKELSGTAASHSRLLYFQRLCEMHNTKPWLFAAEAEEIYWSAFMDGITARPGLHRFLQATHELPIALVTDLSASIQFRKIKRLGIEHRISAIVSSEEAGCEKPDPRIFKSALSKLSMESEDVCMIGDAYDKDICGATALGIKAFWIKASAPPKPTSSEGDVIEFSKFDELMPFFEHA